ncbi:DUF4296 domain-containing protein [Flavobacteriaceae bacterium XHP0103]|uniref:DUF4296 domain-containing protein n=1 Tax=Marixanthotalea marina TaxID=2844359 RepID=UPI002989CDC8|nr:DUF4296 domain-containing protein [Marixanthotalea marina]MBU3822099.1 DUF4296 domain-containing protein [Marixanthotalea marina]
MLKKIITYIVITAFLVSCYQLEKPKKPNDLISKTEMVNILVDLKLLTSINGQNTKVLDSNNVDVDNYVYKKYSIDSMQFVLSSNYYASNLDEYIDIYEKVKDSLDALSEYYMELEGKPIDDEEGQDKRTVNKPKLKKELAKPALDK